MWLIYLQDFVHEDESGFVDNRSCRQLQADVEIHFSNNSRLGPDENVPKNLEINLFTQSTIVTAYMSKIFLSNIFNVENNAKNKKQH